MRKFGRVGHNYMFFILIYSIEHCVRLMERCFDVCTASTCVAADDVRSYLELSLGGESMIHSVTTQGSARVAHWVTSYKLQYVSYDESRWRTILNADGTHRVFTGNTDQNTAVTNELRVGIVANKIRLLPVSSSGRADVRLIVNACKLPRKFQLLRKSLHEANVDS